MAERRPIVLIDGDLKELPSGDTLPGSGDGTGTIPLPHRYWRLYFTANNGDANHTVAVNVRWLDSSGMNLVGSGVAAASSSFGANYNADKAYASWTSDSTNYWSTSAGQGTPSWVSYDFGVPVSPVNVTMTGVRLNTRMPRDFDIQYSDDGVSWSTARSYFGETDWIIGGSDTRTYPFSAPASNTFTDLTDTPADYTGHGGKVVAVNGSEDGLEFITPSGGGGGGYHAVNFGSLGGAVSTSAYATKGNIFTPGLSFALYTVSADLNASQTVMATLAEVNSSNVITSILWQSSPQVVGGSRRDVYYTGLGGITLSAGVRYALMATRTDGTATSILGIPFKGAAAYPNLPMGVVYVANIRYASTSPSVSDSIAFNVGPTVDAARFRLGMAFTP